MKKWHWLSLALLTVFSLLVEFSMHHDSTHHHWWTRIPAFWIFFGFLGCIILIIFPALGIIFTWAAIQNQKQSNAQVVNQARILSRQIVLTRQWVTDSGGVFADCC